MAQYEPKKHQSVNLLSRTIHNNFKKVEVSNLTPYKGNIGCCGSAVLDLETMVEWVLCGLSIILQVEHQSKQVSI